MHPSLVQIDIDRNLRSYREGFTYKMETYAGRTPFERYASFDYCYNYFYGAHRDRRISELASRDNIQISCMHLGFYLASWGMLRGSSFLLNKSVKHYEEVIKRISHMDTSYWTIDVDKYSSDNISQLMKIKYDIIDALGKENRPTDTLITKIMLGVFGNVPAFDNNFKAAFHVSSLNPTALRTIAEYYGKQKEIINSYNFTTMDFTTGLDTNIQYPKAKIIDMVGFIEGIIIEANKSKNKSKGTD